MNILIDESIDYHFRYRGKKSDTNLRVSEVLGKGTKDPEIEEYAEKNNLVILTGDHGLAKNQIRKDRPVILADQRHAKRFLFENGLKKYLGKIRLEQDHVTYWIRRFNQGEPIRP